MDQESESGDEQTICNMTGEQWESMPYPIIIDSGMAASVIPAHWCAHVAVRETEDSKRGKHYIAANGGKIPNEGAKVASMTSKEVHMTECSGGGWSGPWGSVNPI